MMSNVSAKATVDGLSFGAALAMVISYTHNHSILWAIIDGLLSWLFVIYAAVTY